MSNKNCLVGLRCPECKSYGPFRIACKVIAEVYDDGLEHTEGGDWDDGDYCQCMECKQEKLVSDFQEENQG